MDVLQGLFSSEANQQLMCLAKLYNALTDEKTRRELESKKGLTRILQILKDTEHLDLIKVCLICIINSSTDVNCIREILATQDTLLPIINCLRNQDSTIKQYAANALLRIIATENSSFTHFEKCQAIPAFISLLDNAEETVVSPTLGALTFLSLHESSASQLISQGVLAPLLKLIDRLGNQDSNTLRTATKLLLNLCSNSTVLAKVAELGSIPVITKASKTISDNNITMGLTSLLQMLQSAGQRSAPSMGGTNSNNGSNVSTSNVDIKSLIASLNSNNEAQKIQATSFIWNLARNADFRLAFRQNGGLKPLFNCLSSQNLELVGRSAGAICNISLCAENNKMLNDLGTINSLTPFLAVENAPDDFYISIITALGVLSEKNSYHGQVLANGGGQYLVRLLALSAEPVKEKVAALLINLSHQDEHKKFLGQIGTIDALLLLINSSNNELKQNALATLWNLSHNDENYKYLEQVGGLGPLVDLLDSTDLNRTVKKTSTIEAKRRARRQQIAASKTEAQKQAEQEMQARQRREALELEMQEAKNREQKAREQQLLAEQQMKEKQLREQQEREKQLREKQIRDQQLRDQQIHEEKLREQQFRDQQLREQQLRDEKLRREQEQKIAQQKLEEQQRIDKQLQDQKTQTSQSSPTVKPVNNLRAFFENQAKSPQSPTKHADTKVIKTEQAKPQSPITEVALSTKEDEALQKQQSTHVVPQQQTVQKTEPQAQQKVELKPQQQELKYSPPQKQQEHQHVQKPHDDQQQQQVQRLEEQTKSLSIKVQEVRQTPEEVKESKTDIPKQQEVPVQPVPDVGAITMYQKNVIKEMLSTEESYVASMKLLMDVFYEPLTMPSHKNTLPLNNVTSIFKDVQLVYKVNVDFLKELRETYDFLNDQDAREEDIESVAQLFIKRAPTFKLYTTYINNYSKAVTMLDISCEKYKPFAEFLAKCSAKLMAEGARQTDIHSFMIMPVQRIPRYTLLLKDLLNHMTKSCPAYEVLSVATSKMKQIADYCNEKQREYETKQQVLYYQEKWNCPGVVKPSRQFIRQGEYNVSKLTHSPTPQLQRASSLQVLKSQTKEGTRGRPGSFSSWRESIRHSLGLAPAVEKSKKCAKYTVVLFNDAIYFHKEKAYSKASTFGFDLKAVSFELPDNNDLYVVADNARHIVHFDSTDERSCWIQDMEKMKTSL